MQVYSLGLLIPIIRDNQAGPLASSVYQNMTHYRVEGELSTLPPGRVP